MPQYVSAIFLDFDNVFGSLYAAGKEPAVNFASDPRRWLSAFTNMRGSEIDETLHKFVIRRCYMNPSGRVREWLRPCTDILRNLHLATKPWYLPLVMFCDMNLGQHLLKIGSDITSSVSF
jgi:hypothetical protein